VVDPAAGAGVPDAHPGRHPVLPSPMRRAIARRMVESKAAAPHFYLSTEIDMGALLSLVDATNEGRTREDRITVTAFLLRAVALTLREHPAFNAAWDGDTVERWDSINIGVAIALDDGLIAPALLESMVLRLACTGAGPAGRAGPCSAPEGRDVVTRRGDHREVPRR
jgi:pyruvate dehydrogenase E2 component (dihydrolipoamide acetyltransferase)